jgi:hypothetical protein
MDWLPLDSRLFTATAYASAERTLYLRFRKTGDVYRYFDFSPDRNKDFLAADSKGRYFLSYIRNKYRYERLARLSLTANDPSL